MAGKVSPCSVHALVVLENHRPRFFADLHDGHRFLGRLAAFDFVSILTYLAFSGTCKYLGMDIRP